LNRKENSVSAAAPDAEADQEPETPAARAHQVSRFVNVIKGQRIFVLTTAPDADQEPEKPAAAHTR